MKLLFNAKIYNEFHFTYEADYEREVVENSKLLFGTRSVYIDAKKKITSKNLGATIPDGLLFDLSDPENPEFYLVEAELVNHDFFKHIFPQVTKFFGFFRNPQSQLELVEKIHAIISEDSNLKKEFKKQIGEREIYKFIKDTVERSQNILLVIDGEKKEMAEIIETYNETWGKMVKQMQLKKFVHNDDFIYLMNPEFENIEFADIENEILEEPEVSSYTEEEHFEGVTDTVRQIYNEIKAQLLNVNPSLIFNPQKYYVSIRADKNIAYFQIRRKKIALIVMYSEEETRKIIKHHLIKSLGASVQKFYNGPSCAIMIENTEHLSEVISLLKKLIKS